LPSALLSYLSFGSSFATKGTKSMKLWRRTLFFWSVVSWTVDVPALSVALAFTSKGLT
jgi:hypothetical protein